MLKSQQILFTLGLVITTRSMFYNCYSLTSLNLSSFDTSSVHDMSFMFYECNSLTSLDINHFNTSSVEKMNTLFYGCYSLHYLNISNFDTSLVINMAYFFYNCTSLTSLDLLNFDTSKTTSMNNMFYSCNSLKFLDLNNFNTSLVEDMTSMFDGCSSLISLNITSFDTSSVKDMSEMFYECKSLKSLNLNNFDTSSLTSMNNMFSNCKSLLSLEISNFNTSTVIDMRNLFFNCQSLITLDLHTFNSLHINNNYLEDMFYNCKNDTIYCINEIIGEKIILNAYLANPNFINNCTEACIRSSKKFISENKTCISDCKYDKIYKYEYNNICYKSCPKNTYISVHDNNKCYKELDGYYLDNNVFKSCYPSCKKCNELGDENDNKCLECYSNNILINDISNSSNCYNICEYYYYFDAKNEYHCTIKDECENQKDKIIMEKKKCIDNCFNDNIYKFEYNNICYMSCPNNTHVGTNNYVCKMDPKDCNGNDFFNNKCIMDDNSLKAKDTIIGNIKSDILGGKMDSILLNLIAGKKSI